MASVRARQDTQRLFLDFRYMGVRCREQTLLLDNARNRKQLELLAQRMEAQMMLGDFNYAEFFPGSSQIAKLEKAGVISGTNTEIGGIESSHKQQTPLFAEFADLWFLENKIQWRGSHTRNVESILNSSLKPSFKDKCVGVMV